MLQYKAQNITSKLMQYFNKLMNLKVTTRIQFRKKIQKTQGLVEGLTENEQNTKHLQPRSLHPKLNI